MSTPPAMPALISTLGNLTKQMLTTYYAMPTPLINPRGTVTDPSVDPTVYMAGTYQRELNLQFFQQNSVNIPNQHAFDDYSFRLDQWFMGQPYFSGPKVLPLPASPKYVQIDLPAFDNGWWPAYCATWTAGTDAPPVNFIVPVPALSAPNITADSIPVVTPPSSPIGAPDGLNIFMSATGDNYPAGTVYEDSTGTYVKQVFQEPMGVVSFWQKMVTAQPPLVVHGT